MKCCSVRNISTRWTTSTIPQHTQLMHKKYRTFFCDCAVAACQFEWKCQRNTCCLSTPKRQSQPYLIHLRSTENPDRLYYTCQGRFSCQSDGALKVLAQEVSLIWDCSGRKEIKQNNLGRVWTAGTWNWFLLYFKTYYHEFTYSTLS